MVNGTIKRECSSKMSQIPGREYGEHGGICFDAIMFAHGAVCSDNDQEECDLGHLNRAGKRFDCFLGPLGNGKVKFHRGEGVGSSSKSLVWWLFPIGLALGVICISLPWGLEIVKDRSKQTQLEQSCLLSWPLGGGRA
jgi:hypothetical protein